ncbi:ParB/RepB/Spo0J family partition protein [Bradyrhizobium sp. USDA 4011]|jgi:ParB/RepB/Spo0J family partition protein|uniref:ParB/RepB/Spo0J family partition protein n=1 Tax=Bradyrhizobium TaxID=374 RepID=UPI00040B202B|nr:MULTISPECIES: ParB/RepB/Spo0J family partition protein [Bradyrhizobium]MDX3970371.1 ParB/RepB/Spo0J family partition protein [Bradyrhizobium sp.]RTM14358.1 MAG: ParB/RepB/Spo0J family partition protein [Bradyrhizobiaceae bacterium]
MALDLSFRELVDVAANPGSATGRPLLVAIDCIDEDPDQPRRNFSEPELEELSQSIAGHGVLQPIVLRRSNEDGRYVIAMGARRYRAAQRAGLREMPAFIQDVALPDRYAQMIENIQRDDLRAAEIARFIADRLDAGDTQAEISRKLGKPRDWVSRYASVQSMPEFLRARLEGSSIRALYELYQAWRTHPDEIERLCATQDSFTDAQARQLARDVRAHGGRANPRNELPARQPRAEKSDFLPEAVLPRNAAKDREAATENQPPKTRVVSQSRSAASLAIRVRYQNRAGQLVIDRLATQGSRHALVLVDGADHEEEVPASALTIEEILSR